MALSKHWGAAVSVQVLGGEFNFDEQPPMEKTNKQTTERTFCVRTHLRQHLVLAPPAQRDGQKVVHHRGRLQADDAVVVVLGNPAEDGVSVGLDERTLEKNK